MINNHARLPSERYTTELSEKNICLSYPIEFQGFMVYFHFRTTPGSGFGPRLALSSSGESLSRPERSAKGEVVLRAGRLLFFHKSFPCKYFKQIFLASIFLPVIHQCSIIDTDCIIIWQHATGKGRT